MDTSKDYYAVLGVDSLATTSTIKAAFKKLALQYHPDVYKGTDAQDRMLEILQAYQILNDSETRDEYDARRGGKQTKSFTGSAMADGNKGSSHSEQGRFAFPDLLFPASSTTTFSLEEIVYQLSSMQAETLQIEGILRGKTLETARTDSSVSSYCHRCHHRWSGQQGSVSMTCPVCHARDWAEYLLLRCVHCQAVFESREIHDPLRGDALYYPYELFPLCPHCRRSQWCPAENVRVNALRAAAARRAVFLWMGMIGGAVVLIVLAAFVFFH